VDHEEIERRFGLRPELPEASAEMLAHIRTSLGEVADELSHLLPECRETELAITRLEETLMWAGKGIERHGDRLPSRGDSRRG